MRITPEFLKLGLAESKRLLERNHVGRIAYLNGALVDIEPVGYVARAGWIFARSAHGSKLAAFGHSPYVAFEVDEVRGPFDWRSVVVHGTVYMLEKDGGPIEAREYDRALASLRTLMPSAMTADDPVPERAFLYGIHVVRIDGRMARSRGRRGGRSRKLGATTKSPRRRGDGF